MLLALKYRPLFFRDVLGQEDTVKILTQNIINKDIRPVYMFVGSWGSGKTTLARIFARALMCPNLKDGEPCNECESCKSSIAGKNLNFLEIDAATHGKIENIRQIKEDASYVPLGISKYKVICLDECHEMKRAAQNALLKQMEETPETTLYILCTTEPEKMLKTVISRSWVFPIQRISFSSIADRLELICKGEQIDYERGALELIVKTVKGHVRDAISKLDLFSTFGKITIDLVKEELDLDLEDVFLEIIKNLKGSVKESVRLTEELLNRVEPSKVYNGLSQKSLDIYRASLVQSSCVEQDIFNMMGQDVLKIADFFLNRRRVIDETTLICDLFLMSSKLNGKFLEAKETIVQQVSQLSQPLPGVSKETPKTDLKSFDDQFKTKLDIIGSRPPTEQTPVVLEEKNKSLSNRFEILSSKSFSMLLVGALKEWLEKEVGLS